MGRKSLSSPTRVGVVSNRTGTYGNQRHESSFVAHPSANELVFLRSRLHVKTLKSRDLHSKTLNLIPIIPLKRFHLDILTEFWDNRILREHRQNTERYERKGMINDARRRWTEPENRFG